jgi:rubrerythrin
MHPIPAGRPTNMYEAFAYIGSVEEPTLDDFRLMVLLEAAGKSMYDDLADDVESPELKAMLRECGHEEWLHAERMSRAVEILSGVPYPVPAEGENPYLVGWVKPRLTRELTDSLAKAEAGGEAMYGGWAAQCGNAEVAALFRQSGREETDHARRLERISAQLAS